MTPLTGALVPGAPPVSLFFTGKTTTPLWPARQVSLLAGSSGAGKTTLLFQLLAAWTANTHFAGFYGPQPPYGFLTADRTTEAHRETAKGVGLPWLSLRVRSLVDDKSINLLDLENNPLELLFKLLTSIRHDLNPGPAFIVVDPLMVFLGVDLNKYNLVAARLIRLNRWAQDHDALVLGTHHASKPRTDWSFKRPQDRIAGSGALLAYTSTQGFLAGPEECGDEQGPATHSEWTIVPHHSAAITVKVIRNELGLFEAMDINGNQETGVDASGVAMSMATLHPTMGALSKAAADIFSSIPDDQFVSRAEIVQLVASERSGDRALQELQDKGLVAKIAHGLYKKTSNQ